MCVYECVRACLDACACVMRACAYVRMRAHVCTQPNAAIDNRVDWAIEAVSMAQDESIQLFDMRFFPILMDALRLVKRTPVMGQKRSRYSASPLRWNFFKFPIMSNT